MLWNPVSSKRNTKGQAFKVLSFIRYYFNLSQFDSLPLKADPWRVLIWLSNIFLLVFFIHCSDNRSGAIRYFSTMCPLILIDRQLLDIKYLKRFSCPLFVATNQIWKEIVYNGPFKICIQYFWLLLFVR